MLQSGKVLRIKLGIDPTGPLIHVGRATILWKLRQFQDLGHQIVLIIGDFTAQIGDASDKQAMRQPMTLAAIKQNMKQYAQQLGLILDMKKVELRHNSEWLGKLKPNELVQLAMNFSVQQMINRRNFKERWNAQKEIGLHELLYPLFQGYDSVAVRADVELGGSDQLFNLMAGRKLQELYGQKPQDVMTMEMIYGLDGRKMSTSWGNIITITDTPQNQYGLIMSLRDELLKNYLLLVARMEPREVQRIIRTMKSGELSALDVKKMLAKKVVSLYHSPREAERAAAAFKKTFAQKEVPDDVPAYPLKQRAIALLDLLVALQLSSSKSDAKRLIEEGAVRVWENGVWKKLDDWKASLIPRSGQVFKAGKRKFAQIQ